MGRSQTNHAEVCQSEHVTSVNDQCKLTAQIHFSRENIGRNEIQVNLRTDALLWSKSKRKCTPERTHRSPTNFDNQSALGPEVSIFLAKGKWVSLWFRLQNMFPFRWSICINRNRIFSAELDLPRLVRKWEHFRVLCPDGLNCCREYNKVLAPCAGDTLPLRVVALDTCLYSNLPE